MTTMQCCDLEAMVSRLDCTRVHFVQVSVSRPDGHLLWSWSRDIEFIYLFIIYLLTKRYIHIAMYKESRTTRHR